MVSVANIITKYGHRIGQAAPCSDTQAQSTVRQAATVYIVCEYDEHIVSPVD